MITKEQADVIRWLMRRIVDLEVGIAYGERSGFVGGNEEKERKELAACWNVFTTYLDGITTPVEEGD